MQRIELNNYAVSIGDREAITGVLNEHLRGRPWSRVAVLVDDNTEHDCWPLVKGAAWPEGTERLEIPSGEEYKSIGTCEGIWEAMVDLGMDRHSLLVNLGGGVIGDMGGFAASTYMRGMAFLNLPTTLLSQVDASVGGKLGVDFNGLKNMIGLFADPLAVLICPEFLGTLPLEQLRSGYAEVLKHALIRDREQWTELAGRGLDAVDDWEALILRSVRNKQRVVEADPTEKGLRKILNFGHTIGHAMESLQLDSDQPLLHGEAIAAGMIAEAWMSCEGAGLSRSDRDAISHALSAIFPHFDMEEVTVDGVLELMRMDKKNQAGEIRLSLLAAIGDCRPDIAVSSERLRDWIAGSLEYYHSLYRG